MSCQNSFKMDKMVDVEHFISEVKRRPVLWDPNHEDYNQRHTKLAAWEEVSANLFVDWCDLSNYDKFGRVRDIQNRWKNIRDSYIRELKYERKVEKGLAMAKKNKYRYSHLLEFMNPGEKRKMKGSDQSGTDFEDSPVKEEIKELNVNFPEFKSVLDPSPMEVDQKNNQVKLNGNRRAKRLKQNNDLSLQFNLMSDSSTMDSDSNNQTGNENVKLIKTSNMLQETIQTPNCSVEIERSKSQLYKNRESNNQSLQDYFPSEHIQDSTSTFERHSGPTSLPLEQDDDKMFLLSLVPYFKKLNEERKLQARIEMASLLHTIIYKKS